jgi:hypothetical protein
MIAQRPRPFVFVHIPKCAGTSIEHALIYAATGRRKPQELSLPERQLHWLPGSRRQHARLEKYAQSYALGEYFKFSFVRNPWDRAISQIDYLRQKFMEGRKLFSSNHYKENLWTYCNSSARIGFHNLALNQIDYLTLPSGALGVDFIGRFESLQQDFQTICPLIGLEPPPSLPHAINAKRDAPYHSYYDAESADWVRRRFSKDIKHFGYDFETKAFSHRGE